MENEQTAREISNETEDSLLLFRTPSGNIAPHYTTNAAGSHIMQAKFDVEAHFSARGNCGDWEYRQEIRGNAWARSRGSPRVNINHHLNLLPHGSLTQTGKKMAIQAGPASITVTGRNPGGRWIQSTATKIPTVRPISAAVASTKVKIRQR